MENSCIFCDIASGSSPAKIRYEDDKVVAFDDMFPQAPHHYLIIPRKHIVRAVDLTVEDNELVGHIFQVANQIATEEGFADDGFRVLTNSGEQGGQVVWHLHFHLMGGREMNWPPG